MDFYSPELKLVIELDGELHNTSDSIKYDEVRTQFLQSLGMKVIRFKNHEVLELLSDTLEKIKLEILKIQN